jgi:hypothetical protein
MSSGVPRFDSDDYRRRVLAAVHARGGAEESDPFEIYDLPLDGLDQLTDAAVAAQVEAVWAFWQRNRDHPRYRGTILGLLSWHSELSGWLADRSSRLEWAERSQAARAARDDERFADVDPAVKRLVERFGGLPEDKLAGLRSLAAAQGIDEVDLTRRLRRWRVLPAGAPERAARAAVSPQVLRQVRADLAELGRVTGTPTPRSLFDLLDLPPGSSREQIRAMRDDLARRNRQRRPDRRRALVDDLLTSVTRLLIDADPGAYLDALATEVAALLRPRVAAAILMEDRLLPEQEDALISAARADGLDPARARAVVATLAREHTMTAGRPATDPPGPATVDKATVDKAPVEGAPDDRAPVDGAPDDRAAVDSAAVDQPARPWPAELSRARAAVRAGQLDEAATHVQAALAAAGELLPPIRAIQDEVERARAQSAAPEPAPEPASTPKPAPVGNVADGLGRAHDLRLEAGKLRWTWPYGCTEAVVAWSSDGPPAPSDAGGAGSRKVTNTRYDIEHGAPLPDDRPLHVAVFVCTRDGAGRLVVATTGTHRHLPS